MSIAAKPELKESISLKILYWITSLFYYVIIIGLIMLITSRALALWEIHFDFASTIGVRLNAALVDPLSLNLSEDLPPIKVTRVTGAIDLKSIEPVYAHTFSILGVLMLLVFIYVLNRLRLFMRNIKNDKVFDLTNTTYLMQAAYGLFIYGFINDILMRIIFAWYFRESDQIKHGLGMDELLFNNGFIFGMILIVIAAIFKRGILLKNETELTI